MDSQSFCFSFSMLCKKIRSILSDTRELKDPIWIARISERLCDEYACRDDVLLGIQSMHYDENSNFNLYLIELPTNIQSKKFMDN
jgi:hypothetical protein